MDPGFRLAGYPVGMSMAPSKRGTGRRGLTTRSICSGQTNHMGWFNSMALEMAGITKDPQSLQGGQILKTDNGELLGCLTDKRGAMVIKVIPTWSAGEAQKNAVLMAQEELFSYGFYLARTQATKVNYIQHYGGSL